MVAFLFGYEAPDYELETLTERVSYDMQAGTCERMAIGVKTRGRA